MSVIVTPTPGSDACIILLSPIYIPTCPIAVNDAFLYITKSPGCKSFLATFVPLFACAFEDLDNVYPKCLYT